MAIAAEPMLALPRLVLLDRDGVLNEDRGTFVKDPSDLAMLPGAAEAVAQIRALGIPIALASNLSAVGRGIISRALADRIHETLVAALARAGAKLDLALYCYDAPERASPRRKPGPGMLREAIDHFRVRPGDAVMIGDQMSDLQAAVAAGAQRILVRTGKGAMTQAQGIGQDILPVSVYDSLGAVAEAMAKLAARIRDQA